MMSTVLYEIEKTTDYEQFGLHLLQPLKRVKATQELVESIRKTNGNSLQPILVSKNTNRIVDGHRRFQAVMAAGTPLYVRYITKKEEEMMSLLNSTSRTWSVNNFIDHWARQDADYLKLKTYLNDKKASVELFRLFAGVSNIMIKNGASVKNINYAKIEKIRRLVVLIKGIFDITTTPVLRTLYKLSTETPKFSYTKLQKQLLAKQRAGEFDKVLFIPTQTKLFTVLDTIYQDIQHDAG